MPDKFLESTLCRTGTFHTTVHQLVIRQPCLHHIITTTGFDTYDQTLFAISDKLCTITCHFLFPCYVALVPEVTALFFILSIQIKNGHLHVPINEKRLMSNSNN